MPPKKKPGKRAKVNRPHSSQRGTNQAANAESDADANEEVGMEEEQAEGDEKKGGEEDEAEGNA